MALFWIVWTRQLVAGELIRMLGRDLSRDHQPISLGLRRAPDVPTHVSGMS
jgi:hypothetical protein